ncbi:hypothetical protein [Glutamicibacter mishrai]|uniref:Uncharacterized protein n=1 Tax=Glutamicibacter mishrai TaxID=1775880 RepID=A0A6H0SEV4_9MICC|nr:hypothetical protein D3791_00200 [Glutamicibacter mishrai]
MTEQLGRALGFLTLFSQMLLTSDGQKGAVAAFAWGFNGAGRLIAVALPFSKAPLPENLPTAESERASVAT